MITMSPHRQLELARALRQKDVDAAAAEQRFHRASPLQATATRPAGRSGRRTGKNRARQPRLLTRLLSLMVAGIVAGCAGSGGTTSQATVPADASTTVAPTAAATPALSADAPTPAPPASAPSAETAFRQLVARQDWALIANLSGTLITSIEGNDVYINPAHGVVQLAGGDAHLLVAAPDPSGIRAFEEIRIAGMRSTRGPDGLWQLGAAEPESVDLLGALLSVPSVHADGTETVEGEPLTALVTDEPVTIGSIGGVRASEEDATASLRFLVDDTGYPVRIRLDLEPLPGMPAVGEKLELVVAPPSGPFYINPAADWERYDSARGYSILMPASCQQLPEDEHWEEFDCGQQYLRIWTAKTSDSASTWTKGSIAAWSDDLGVKPDIEDTLRVGTHASGTNGVITTYRYVDQGTDATMSDGVFVHGGTGYDVVVLGIRENETSDRAFFIQELATIRFKG